MNFFFGVKYLDYSSEIQIPKFQNKSNKIKPINLYQAFISEGKWQIDEVTNIKIHDHFFILEKEIIDNKKIFFLATKDEVTTFEEKKLKNYNKFTDTSPAFRANLKIKKLNGGFSSYQSEYPFNMILNNGSITSGISSLTNVKASENFLIFRNIFVDPIERQFNIYFVNLKTKKILKQDILLTNKTNIVKIDKDLIHPEIFVISKNYLGIPIFLSEKNGHLSLEHTHPPHEYVKSHNKFDIVKRFKDETNKIIL